MSSRELLQIMADRRNRLRILLEISRSQLQLIESEEFDELWNLQHEKQNLMREIDPTSRSDDLRRAWFAIREKLTPAERSPFERLIEESEELLQSLMQEEAVASTVLQDRIGETRAQLNSIAQGMRLRQAYQSSHPAQSGRLIDLET